MACRRGGSWCVQVVLQWKRRENRRDAAEEGERKVLWPSLFPQGRRHDLGSHVLDGAAPAVSLLAFDGSNVGFSCHGFA